MSTSQENLSNDDGSTAVAPAAGGQCDADAVEAVLALLKGDPWTQAMNRDSWVPPGGSSPTLCEVDDCPNPARICECGAGHCDTHPHIADTH